MNVLCPCCKAYHWLGEQLKKSKKNQPTFGDCCLNGKIKLPVLQRPPPALHSLLIGDNVTSKEFREHIIGYNNALAFTSLGGKFDNSINQGRRGPWIYRLHGAMYHNSGGLLPREGKNPVYAQLYILDPREALRHRTHHNPDLNHVTLTDLQDMMIHHHQYATIYKEAYKIAQDHVSQHPAHLADVQIRLHFAAGSDQRTHNLPTADEVAAIIPGDGSEHLDPRDVVLHLHTGQFQHIHDSHPAYQTLHFVLWFPYGEHGWHENILFADGRAGERKRISQSDYYAYRLYPREGEADTLFRSGRLFQQWIVDSWATVEQDRLRFNKQNQEKLCADLYKGLVDAIPSDGNLDPNDIGKKYILPSSFTGSSRHMQQNFQDSMAITRNYGKPDAFVTMTANP
ncbi:hypothetical protein BD410DRAFT_703287, partial [Rickenella mellea]